jgi:hypothetical protein
MMRGDPILITAQGVQVLDDPAVWRARFAEVSALALPAPLDPALLARLLRRAGDATYVDDEVRHIGTRAIEAPQRVGAAISLLLHDTTLCTWLAAVTGSGPLRAVAGRLVETRCNGRDALGWHDDSGDDRRRLAVVIDLADRRYQGGRFELRRKGETAPVVAFDHPAPGSMLVFAVRDDLEHRVTPVISGGPRRVYAGWFLSRPEFAQAALGTGPLFGSATR